MGQTRTQWLGLLIGLMAVTVSTPVSAFGNSIAVTSAADSGSGSLRQAISSASAGDTINVSVGGTIVLTSGALPIRQNLTIIGPGPNMLAIDGNHSSRIFTVADVGTATVTISGVALQNGSADSGGAILNGGVLTLTNVVVSGNSASALGGGIFNGNNAVLSVANSIISSNSAGSYGGGIYTEFGSLLKVSNCNVSGNSASVGGGITNHDGTVSLSSTTVSGNTAAGAIGGSGGGVYNGGVAGTVDVENSTIANNTASEQAGAIYHATGVLTINNSTIAGNVSTCNSGGCSGGGGVYNLQATALISNSTLSANVSASGGNIISLYGTTTVKNSILASGQAGKNCSYYYSIAFASQGHNLSDDISCVAVLAQPSDLNGVDAGLDPNGLQNNGGPTQTIALVPISPAVDAVPLDACTDSTGPLTTDERGVARPQGVACDIGAFEMNTPYLARVQPPIQSDGTSVFSSNRGVVPVKFALFYSGSSTCDLPPASISLFRTAGATVGSVNESTYTVAADEGSSFRIDSTSCQYVYNLGTSSLGSATYRVYVSIGQVVIGSGAFGLK